MTKVCLGDEVQDVITKLRGIVIGRSEWLYGCVRVVVQPQQAKDGKPVEPFHIDEPQCLVLQRRALKTEWNAEIEEALADKPAGPRTDTPRRQEVSRGR